MNHHTGVFLFLTNKKMNMSIEEFNEMVTKVNWLTENGIGWRFYPTEGFIRVADDGQQILPYTIGELDGVIYFADFLNENDFKVELSDDRKKLTLYADTPIVLTATPKPVKPKT
ncbi:MAG: hypothetical protein AABY93_11735 [Bacteroidota bacterium]